MKLIAVNASPRPTWNTAMLVREAARGAEAQGAEAEVFDLYRLDKFTGCISCFGCKLEPNRGRCICRDGLYPLLEKIREADGLILGSPNYLGTVSAGFHALYERLIFQCLTYKTEPRNYDRRHIPVLFIMTSNAPAESYAAGGYYEGLVENYRDGLTRAIGPTRTMICGSTLQVKDYSRFDWTMFDGDARQKRRLEVFPSEMEHAFSLGAQMAQGEWE